MRKSMSLLLMAALAIANNPIMSDDAIDDDGNANSDQDFISMTKATFNNVNQQIAVFMETLNRFERAEKRRMAMVEIEVDVDGRQMQMVSNDGEGQDDGGHGDILHDDFMEFAMLTLGNINAELGVFMDSLDALNADKNNSLIVIEDKEELIEFDEDDEYYRQMNGMSDDELDVVIAYHDNMALDAKAESNRRQLGENDFDGYSMGLLFKLDDDKLENALAYHQAMSKQGKFIKRRRLPGPRRPGAKGQLYAQPTQIYAKVHCQSGTFFNNGELKDHHDQEMSWTLKLTMAEIWQRLITTFSLKGNAYTLEFDPQGRSQFVKFSTWQKGTAADTVTTLQSLLNLDKFGDWNPSRQAMPTLKFRVE